jgi:ubiquinone/menaquinone biosynthesis C-methylase UbiE
MFPLPDELVSIFEDIGFGAVRYDIMTNGISVAHVGVKL